MTTAFVYSGGASLGSIQVGMTTALFEAGIRPDLLIGTSAGAINAGFLATHPDATAVDELGEIWRSLKRNAIFPLRPLGGLLGFVGRRNHLCSPDPLRRVLTDTLGNGDISETTIPLQVVATDLATGREKVLTKGSLVDAVLASASLPGVFPPVEMDGRMLIDGGVTNNAPLSHAVRSGAVDVYLLVCGHSCALPMAPSSAIGVVLQAVSVLIGRQLVADVENYEERCRLHVVPQLCPVDVLPMDFSKADMLIRRGYESASAWLQSRPPLHGQSAGIEPHRH